jgi:hypothetical protein
MKLERPLLASAMIIVFSGAIFACSPNSQGIGSGSGGASGSGGQGGSGGATGNGGTTATGGTTASGGTIAAGGTTAGGGSTGLGGATVSGGTTASGGNPGGATGSGGKTGSGGTAGGGTAGSGGAAGGGGTAGSGSTGGSGGGGGGGGAAGGGTGGAAGGGSGGAAGGGGAAGSGGTSAAGGSAASVDCTDTSTSSLSFTKQYQDGEITVTGSTKTYHTMTNWWHKFGGQTVNIDGLSMTVGNSQAASVPASDGNPMGFPTIFIGSYQSHTTVGSNLPMQVSAIKSVPTIFSTNASTLDTSNFNATYDVWFTSTGTPLGAKSSSPGAGGAYLMVWLYKPADRQPRGGSGSATGTAPNHPAMTIAGVPGTWDVWVDSSTDPPCISYVSSTPLDSLSYDLNNFIKDAVTNKYGVTSSMYLSLVFAGFEIWSGGDGLTTKQFCAAVN